MLGGAPTLESNYWFGAQGNRLWVGQVEGDGNVFIDGTTGEDQDGSYRVKVRIMGYHTRSRKNLKPQDLPWASVMMPTTETITRDHAGATHGLEVGMWVLGTFMDGESAQQPVVMGSLGIVDKNQPYEDRLEDIGGTNNFPAVERALKTRDQNKSPEGHGASNRGTKRGDPSAADERQAENEKVVIAVSNGKCGPRPENEISRILGDLFKFLSSQERLDGGVLVDKLTGNITRSADIISGYFGRLANSVNGLLGDIKALVVAELKKLFETTLLPIISGLTATPTGRGVAITAGMKFADVIFEIIKCIFQTVLEKVYNLILDILTSLVDDILNTAFCQVSNILKGIVGEIQNGIGSALSALGEISSLIGGMGGFNGGFLANIGKLISMFCDGKLGCILGIGDFTTGIGDRPDNAVGAFFNRLETFGGLPNELNTGLYGSDSFLSSIEGTEIRDSSGNIVKGTLDCNKATSFNFPMIPDLFFTGLQNELNQFKLKGSLISYEPGPSGSGGGDPYPKPNYDASNPTPYALPVVNSFGSVIGAVVTNPGFGLENPPNVTVYPAPGWGSGAEITATLDDNGGVKDLIVLNSGGGYPYFDGSVSNSEIVSTDENGDPNYDKISGIYPGNEYWLGIITENNPPVVTKTGSGYDESCALIVEPGDNEVNEVVLPQLKPIIQEGFLVGIEVVREGFGFTDLPKIYMSCGSGVGLGSQRRAVIKPILNFIPRKDSKDYLNNYDEFRTIIDCVGHPGD